MSSRVLIGACIASLYACGADSSVGGGTGGLSGAAGTGAKSARCMEDYLDFSVGPSSMLETNAKAGIAVRVVDGPVPPVFGYNTWTIELLDATTMQPAPNARITWACSFMAVHGHGANPKSIESLGNGRYKIGQQNMRMVGPWEVKYWIDPTGQMPEYDPASSLIDGMACRPSTGVQGDRTIEFHVCVPDLTD